MRTENSEYAEEIWLQIKEGKKVEGGFLRSTDAVEKQGRPRGIERRSAQSTPFVGSKRKEAKKCLLLIRKIQEQVFEECAKGDGSSFLKKFLDFASQRGILMVVFSNNNSIRLVSVGFRSCL